MSKVSSALTSSRRPQAHNTSTHESAFVSYHTSHRHMLQDTGLNSFRNLCKAPCHMIKNITIVLDSGLELRYGFILLLYFCP